MQSVCFLLVLLLYKVHYETTGTWASVHRVFLVVHTIDVLCGLSFTIGPDGWSACRHTMCVMLSRVFHLFLLSVVTCCLRLMLKLSLRELVPFRWSMGHQLEKKETENLVFLHSVLLYPGT